MPIDPDTGRYYAGPDESHRTEVAPTVLTADLTAPAWVTAEIEEVYAQLGKHAYYRTALAGANNDLDWIARAPGAGGLALSVEYINPGANNAALSVTFASSKATVHLATGSGGAITTTAQDIIDYVNGNEAASVVEQDFIVQVAPGNDGTGVVVALAAQTLADWAGTTPTLDVTLETTADDGATWYTLGSFPQQVAVGATVARAFSGLGQQCRWKLDLGGITPVVAASVSTDVRREY